MSNEVVDNRVDSRKPKGGSDISTQPSQAVSRSMRGNKAQGTLPELELARLIWGAGHRGYRKNDKRVVGRPDIYFPRFKVAVMLNGCFWHRCPHCSPSMPKTNTAFWREKFERNKRRDTRQAKERRSEGIRTLVVWECILWKTPGSVLSRLRKALDKQSEIHG
jgi:DNA mismatch endonuclease (patch repair protein)